MRIPEYRAKRMDGAGWIEGSHSYRTFGEGEPQHFIRRFDDMISREIKPETLQQFTGMIDPNGIKIWEGDIIQMDGDSIDTKNIVIWKDYYGCFDVATLECEPSFFAICDNIVYQVAGNILDIDEIADGRRIRK